MKGYKYTIESIGGIVTCAISVEPIVVDLDVRIFCINKSSGGRIFLNTCYIIRITEQEVEV